MKQTESFVSRQPGKRLSSSHFNSNGDLDDLFTFTESFRTGRDPEVQHVPKRRQIDKKRSILDRSKVVAIEMKSSRGKVGLRALQTRRISPENAVFSPIHTPKMNENRAETSRTKVTSLSPHLSDLTLKSKSRAVSPKKCYRVKALEASVEELFVTEPPKHSKPKAITYTKSLLRIRKPGTDHASSVTDLGHPLQVKHELMPLLHEAVQIEGEIRKRANVRTVHELAQNNVERPDLVQQDLALISHFLIKQKSLEKVRYIPRVQSSLPSSPKSSKALLRLGLIRNDSQIASKSRAEKKWRWTGMNGTMDSDQT